MSSPKSPSPKAEQSKSNEVIEIVEQVHTLNEQELKEVEVLVESAGVVHKEIDAAQSKTAIKIVWQGCLLYVVDETLSTIEDKKVRDALFNQLLAKYGIARVTANQRILLVRRMLAKKAITERLLRCIDGSEKITPEAMELLDKSCGRKLAVELQREFGVRQPLKDKEAKVKEVKSWIDQFKHQSTIVTGGLKEMAKILKDKLADDDTKEELRRTEHDLGKEFIKLRKILIDYVPEKILVDAVALAAINPPEEAVMA